MDYWLFQNRWMMVAAGMWIMCCSGSSYLYSEYSQVIKNSLHYDQQTLETLGSFKELGESVGLASGFLDNLAPTWVLLTLGALQITGGYLMAYLSVKGIVASPRWWLIAIYLCVAANGQTYFITAVMVNVVKQFPMSRGLIIGVMKGIVGLSAAILTQIDHGLYASEASSLLLFLSWFPTLVVFGSYIFFAQKKVDQPPEVDENECLYLNLFAIIALVLAAFILGIIVVQNVVPSFPLSASQGVCVVIGVLLLLPLGIVIASRPQARRPERIELESTDPLLPPQLSSNNDSIANISPEYGTFAGELSRDAINTMPNERLIELPRADSFQGNHFPVRGEDHSWRQALRSGDFWLLLAIAGIGLGSGLTAIDNMGQVGFSLGYSEASITSSVSIFSILNFLGRLGAGVVSDHFLKLGRPRPVFIRVAMVVLSLGHTIMGLALPGALYIGSVMIGLGFGAHCSLITVATSELFGLKNFGTLLNAVTLASPVGSYLLSVRLAGYLYGVEAHKQDMSLQGSRRLLATMSGNIPGGKLFAEDEDMVTCKGAVCFRLTFYIMAGVCVVGCLLSTVLIARTRTYYVAESHHVNTQSERLPIEDQQQQAAALSHT